MAIQTNDKTIKELIIGDWSSFHIPIYQRDYTWEVKQHVKKLLDDIFEFGREYQNNHRAEYYIGNIIIKEANLSGSNIIKKIIDGQQRITTSILIYCAIRDIYKDYTNNKEKNNFANFIQKAIYSNDNELRLKINNMNNQPELTSILSGDFSSINSTTYTKNYKFIINYLQKKEESALENFVDLLHRVKVVVISLDIDQDENSVFESINSLGKPLTGADLIKNYLFTFNFDCDEDCESRLIKLYLKFESVFNTNTNKSKQIESFFRIFIAIKTGVLHTQEAKRIYYEFKKTIGNIESIDKCIEILDELFELALIYNTLKNLQHDDINNNYLNFISPEFGNYAPLLINVLNEYSHINKNNELIIDNIEEFNKFLKFIVYYQVVHFIASYSSNGMVDPRFIATAFRDMKNGYAQYDNYTDKFRAIVSCADRQYKLPNKKEIETGAITTDLYTKKRKRIKNLLILIENIDNKEPLSYTDNAQIEHIIPQKLPDNNAWSHINKDNHKEYLHTLGNLTLTLHNPTLSNLGFNEKKNILNEKSSIKLNRELIKYDNFDIKIVEERALSLVNSFLDFYQID